MRETRTSGSVRGASGNGRPYRERFSPVAYDPATVASRTNCGPSAVMAGTAQNAP